MLLTVLRKIDLNRDIKLIQLWHLKSIESINQNPMQRVIEL